VFLGSAELAAIASRLGKLPTKEEYLKEMGVIDADKSSVYRYMNFDQIEEYADVARGVSA
jgi:aconitate hydratase 2/2-methylisocitrate dehydratase